MKISFIYVQTLEGNNVVPPIGLMYVAAVAREAGHVVQFMDVGPSEIDVVERVKGFAPELVGLSFLTTEFDKSRNLSHKLREGLPGIKLCCGWVHATVDPESVLRSFGADFCVLGEGELTFIDVCKRIESNRSYEDIKGLCFLKNGKLVTTPRRELIDNLDFIPFPARDLINFSCIYLTFPGVIRGSFIRSTVVMAGRGCCFNCSFCCVEKMFGRGYRLRSPENILDEIIYLQKSYGVKGIYFMDSTLTSNRKWIISFCEEIIKRKMKFIWSGNTRVDTVDMDMLRIMKRAGCIQLDYGVESGSPKILELLNKRILPYKAISAVKMTQKAGIRVGSTFMIGNPCEEIKDLEMTFDLAKKLSSDYTAFFFSVPFPGTRLRKIALERKLVPNNIDYNSQWNIRQAEFPLMIENISREDMQRYRAKFQNYFFLRNYARFSNVVVGLYLLLIMLKNPFQSLRAIKAVFRHKRWDSFIEEILVVYRSSLYRYY